MAVEEETTTGPAVVLSVRWGLVLEVWGSVEVRWGVVLEVWGSVEVRWEVPLEVWGSVKVRWGVLLEVITPQPASDVLLSKSLVGPKNCVWSRRRMQTFTYVTRTQYTYIYTCMPVHVHMSLQYT